MTGNEGNRRKDFPTMRGRRPRLHRTRFMTNVGPVFPDERRPVWPRPFAADYVETVTTDLSSTGRAKEEGCFEGSEF